MITLAKVVREYLFKEMNLHWNPNAKMPTVKRQRNTLGRENSTRKDCGWTLI